MMVLLVTRLSSRFTPELGDWAEIKRRRRREEHRLMADSVIIMGRARSHGFRIYMAGQGEGHDYFYNSPVTSGYANFLWYVRPRITATVMKPKRANGIHLSWCPSAMNRSILIRKY